ncbi:MAG: hypothetical protein ACYSP9_03285 [Planctomycetota bacterium]|jgi:hypothetical protein
MRKIIFALVLLMLAAPAWAEVLITGAQVGDEPNAIVSFANSEGQHVRAFSIDIIVDGGAVITAVECLNDDYYVYPGSIQISDNTVTNPGTCVCDDSYDDTLPGLDSNGVTIEMASLYSVNDVEHPNAPLDAGDLLKITLSGNDTQTICIRANGLRGGVVMEDASTVEPNAPCFQVDLPASTCMGDGHPDFAEWQLVGEPNCWCYPRQCSGDADGLQQFGLFWVYTGDLNIFKIAFAQTVLPPDGICCDSAHDIQFGLFRVYTTDLNIFKTYFANTVVPCCDGNANCDANDDAYFNFWMTP